MKLTIIHSNDTHSYLDDFDKRAFLIEQIRARDPRQDVDTLVIGAGDVFSGDIYFNLYHGQKEAELLNLLGYDAMTFGNHEFDGGSKILADFIARLDFPMVSSNVHFAKDKDLAPLENSQKIKPYLLRKNASGKTIGIFGLTTLETLENGYPSAETVIDEPFAVAREMVAQLKKLGADAILLISHLGDDVDVQLARQVAGINVIVGGHTHVLLRKPVIVGQTAIVQAGYYGKYLGELQVEIDEKTGKLLTAQEIIHETSQALLETNDPLRLEMMQLRADKDKIAAQVVAQSQTEILGDRTTFDRQNAVLGNLICDAYFAQAEEDGFAPDVAVMNSFGIRKRLPAGNVTVGDLIKTLPFSKHLTILKVSGQDLMSALEHGLAPQVSHLQLQFHGKADGVKKLLTAQIWRDNQWLEIAPEQTYTVATNSFVGAGKDNFDGFKRAQMLAENLELDVDLLRHFLEKLPQPFEYHERARIFYE